MVTAITSQRVLLALYIQPTYVVLLAVVVVGKVTPMTVKVPFQVNALPVPLSKSLNISFSPFVGVPIGALIVSADARAVYA